MRLAEKELQIDPRFDRTAARYRNIEVPPLLVGIYPVSNTYKAGVGRTIRCQNRSGGSGERFTLKYGSKSAFFSENIFFNIFFRVENNSGAFWELFWQVRVAPDFLHDHTEAPDRPFLHVLNV